MSTLRMLQVCSVVLIVVSLTLILLSLSSLGVLS